MSENGSWGSLPEVVQNEVLKRSSMIVKMTGKCTVKCSFCVLADKGEDKVSFDSLRQLMTTFRDGQKPTLGVTRSDTLYWGTDPFDAHWDKTSAGDTQDLDYLDVAEMYWDLMKGKRRTLYSSTAMPIGEEIRVLNFADTLMRRKNQGSINENDLLRISLTDANSKRVDAVKTVLQMLHGSFEFDKKGIQISDNRDELPLLSGKEWDKSEISFSYEDVIGVNCKDDVVISVNGAFGMIMEASSNERPIGETRFVLGRKTDNAMVYVIPHHQHSPVLFNTRPKDIYPDVKVSIVEVGDDGQTNTVVESISDNPHRTFLRIIGIVTKHCAGNSPDQWKLKNLKKKQKRQLRREVGKESVQLVRDYLASGVRNVAMEGFMREFDRYDVFPQEK